MFDHKLIFTTAIDSYLMYNNIKIKMKALLVNFFIYTV